MDKTTVDDDVHEDVPWHNSSSSSSGLTTTPTVNNNSNNNNNSPTVVTSSQHHYHHRHSSTGSNVVVQRHTVSFGNPFASSFAVLPPLPSSSLETTTTTTTATTYTASGTTEQGNHPHTTTNMGIIYTSNTAERHRRRRQQQQYNNHNNNNILWEEPVQAVPHDQVWLAMLHVPPEQVPEGVLHLLRSHVIWIAQVRIVIAEPNDGDDERVGVVQTSGSSLGCHSAEKDAVGVPSREELPPPPEQQQQRSYTILLQVRNHHDEADQIVQDLQGQPYTSMDESQVAHLAHVVAWQGPCSLLQHRRHRRPHPHCPPSVPVPTNTATNTKAATSLWDASLPPDTTTNTTVPTINNSISHNCPVCLETMETTTYDDNDKNDSTDDDDDDDDDDNEEEDINTLLTTVCNHTFHLSCLAQCQGTACPVCRYDHAELPQMFGRGGVEGGPPGTTGGVLSQCHTCGTTVNVYVCLICGVVSCGGSNTGTGNIATAATAATTNHTTMADRDDLEGPQSHARQHYQETLHAYALQVHTQHVWDFCGQGYVHRLLHNKDDGKLVEIVSPQQAHGSSLQRTLSPGLSTAQEEQVVHHKLETMATSYHALLTNQLQAQRVHYEERITALRHEASHVQERRVRDWVSALKQQKQQLMQRLETLRQKHAKAVDDTAFLQNMNESLVANQVGWQGRLQQVQEERASVQRMLAECLPPLQEKVTRLMLQLESQSSVESTVTTTPNRK